MFDLERAVLRWRESQERESSLSPCEVDELEDHLRARFDLELDLDAALAPATAFAIARHELGEGATLDREFAKARKPKWRRWLVAGWALLAASFLLPVGGENRHEVYWHILQYWPARETLRALLPDLMILLTLPALLGVRLFRGRWVRWLVTGVGLWSVGSTIIVTAKVASWYGVSWWVGLDLTAYWTWSLSFLCAAIGLWLRDRRRATVMAEKSTA